MYFLLHMKIREKRLEKQQELEKELNETKLNVSGLENKLEKKEDLHKAAALAAVQLASQKRQNMANASMYWPGIQGLISNPNVWRDRFNGKTKNILL